MYNGLASRSLIGVEKYNIFLRKNLYDNAMIKNKRKENDSMKKNVKRYVSLAMAASLIFGSMNSSEFVKSAEKISLTKSVKVTVGKSSVLILKNNKKKVTWKVVKGTKIVKITKKSKTGCTVIGLKKGTATVQADVEKKSYKCTVTVIAKKTELTTKPDKTVQPDETPVSKVIEYDGTNKNEVAECKEKFRLIIKDGVDKIPDTEFCMCTNLAEVIIPSSVTYIGYDAFGGCYYLKEVTIPANVKEISYKAFNGCSSLESINVDRQNKVYDSRGNCNAVIKSADNELIIGCKNTIIPKNVSKIGDEAFKSSELKAITIPASVTNIGENPFSFCYSLESINVDKQNKIYDSRENCNAVIKSADNELIIGCKDTIIPENVSKIGKAAFYGSVDLKYMDIPQNIKEIGDEAFGGCKELKNVTIPSGVIKIGIRAFSSCGNLTSITIPESVTDIGMYAFEFSGLESITIPSNITEIKRGTFQECSELKDVTIPSNIINIGYLAFSECFSLINITIPSSVKNIDEEAFRFCNNLKNITWNGNTYNSFTEFYAEFSN